MWLKLTCLFILLVTGPAFAQTSDTLAHPVDSLARPVDTLSRPVDSLARPASSGQPIATPVLENAGLKPGANQPATAGQPVTAPVKGTNKISGIVVDSALTSAVEFANVALYSLTTNKLVDGTVADDKGRFTLARVAPGPYKILISFIGFSAKTIPDVTVVKGQDVNLGPIRLMSRTKTLNEVTVTGQKALVEDKVDRLVFNADRDLSSKGGDATDILKKVPMLTVDLAGNVSLQGSPNVRVLINNKPSSILAGNLADALRQIPADLIKTVEVITSPSARYDAEGTGGIINIITKKNTLQGVHLDVDGGLGNRASNVGLNGNFRKGKVGLSLTGNGRAIYNKAYSDLQQDTRIPNADQSISTVRTSQQIDAFDHGMFGQYALGLDYDLAKNQSLTANARFGMRNLNRDQHQTNNIFTDAAPGVPARRDVNSHDLNNSVDLNVDYLHTYKPQQEWSISSQYSRSNLTNNFDANLLGTAGETTSRQRNLNFNTSTEFVLQTDYQTPITERQSLEFGGKTTIRQVNSTYQYQIAGPTTPYATDVTRPSGLLDYNLSIGAAYLSYSLTTLSKITIKAGARYEYTHVSAAVQQGPINIPAYGKLVPSVNISRKITENGTLKLAYNRRIQRPGVQDLNPNFNAANPLNIRKGNPYLRPEITDRIELGYSTYIKKTYLNFTVYTRLNRDDIQSLSQRSDTLAGAVVTTVSNIGKEYNYGGNIFGTFTLTPTWTANINLELMYRFISGLAPDLSGESVTLSNRGFRVGGRFDTQAQLGKGWAVQAGFGSRGRDTQLQGYRTGFAQYSMGVRKEFASKRGSLGLAADNFLTNGQTFSTVLHSAPFDQNFKQKLYNSTVRLTFSYKLGRLNVDERKKRKGGDDEE